MGLMDTWMDACIAGVGTVLTNSCSLRAKAVILKMIVNFFYLRMVTASTNVTTTTTYTTKSML